MLTLSSTVSTLQLVCMSFKRTFGAGNYYGIAICHVHSQSRHTDNISSYIITGVNAIELMMQDAQSFALQWECRLSRFYSESFTTLTTTED